MSCYKCGTTEGRLHKSFGKLICGECLEKRKTGVKGHSGMIYRPETKPENYPILPHELTLIEVKKSHPLFVKWFIEHYPQSKGIVGRQLNYLIYYKGSPIGIIGFASPPLNYKLFNKYFGLNGYSHGDNAKLFLNNNVYRLVHGEKNQATQVLSIARKTIKKRYKEKYGDDLLGLVTFVKPPLTGGIYKGDNWEHLGETQGIEVKRRGVDWTQKQYSKGVKKHIYGYKYPIKKMRVRRNM